MCHWSLMTSNIFLRDYITTALLTDFTTLKRESPVQRTVQVTKKSNGKKKSRITHKLF